MKNKVILGSYLLIVVLALYSLIFEHGLYGIYTDLMLSNLSVDEAFNSIMLITSIAVLILIVIVSLIVSLVKIKSFNWLLIGIFLIQGYIYGMIILDHYRLKKEPNDGFTYSVIFEKYGLLTDMVISLPFIIVFISIFILLFYIKKYKT